MKPTNDSNKFDEAIRLSTLKQNFPPEYSRAFFADSSMCIFWANSEDFSSIIGKNLHDFFPEFTPSEFTNGIFLGMFALENLSCRILSNGTGKETIYMVSVVTQNDVFDILKSKPASSYLDQIFAKIRHSTFGIVNANQSICSTLEDLELYDDIKLLDIQLGNCYKILKSIFNISELFKFGDEFKLEIFCASTAMTEFYHSAKQMFRSPNSPLLSEIDPNIYIAANKSSFAALLLNLIVEVYGDTSVAKKVKITLKQLGNDTMIYAAAYVGEDAPVFSKDNYSKFVPHDKDYINVRLINEFCARFNGVAYYGNGNSSSYKAIGIRLPIVDSSTATSDLSSDKLQIEDAFSPIKIMLSDFPDTNHF